MKAPYKIYLQICGDCPGVDSCGDCKFEDLEDNVTWCLDRIFEKDVEYVCKDALLGKIDEIIATKPDTGGLAVEVAAQAVSDIRKIIMSM